MKFFVAYNILYEYGEIVCFIVRARRRLLLYSCRRDVRDVIYTHVENIVSV